MRRVGVAAGAVPAVRVAWLAWMVVGAAAIHNHATRMPFNHTVRRELAHAHDLEAQATGLEAQAAVPPHHSHSSHHPHHSSHSPHQQHHREEHRLVGKTWRDLEEIERLEDCPTCLECCLELAFDPDRHADFRFCCLCEHCVRSDACQPVPNPVANPNVHKAVSCAIPPVECKLDEYFDGHECTACAATKDNCGSVEGVQFTQCTGQDLEDTSKCECVDSIEDLTTFLVAVDQGAMEAYFALRGEQSSCNSGKDKDSTRMAAGVQLIIKAGVYLGISRCEQHCVGRDCAEVMFWKVMSSRIVQQVGEFTDADLEAAEDDWHSCSRPLVTNLARSLFSMRIVDVDNPPIDPVNPTTFVDPKPVARSLPGGAIPPDGMYAAGGGQGWWDNQFMRGLMQFCCHKHNNFLTWFQVSNPWQCPESGSRNPTIACCMYLNHMHTMYKLLNLPDFADGWGKFWFKPAWDTPTTAHDSHDRRQVAMKRWDCPASLFPNVPPFSDGRERPGFWEKVYRTLKDAVQRTLRIA